MAFLKVEYEASKDFAYLHSKISKLAELFPEFKASIMGYVGHEAKLRLKKLMISSDLNFKTLEQDIAMREIVSYNIGKYANFVKISSYPLNLFEKGRMLRSGRKEPGRKIITGKLKSLMESDMQSILNKFDKKILQKEIDKVI
jgi:hypothetical protein